MDKGAFSILEAELRARSWDIDRIGGLIEERLSTFAHSAEGIDSMGYQLHNLYGAFEQLFEEVARFFENQIDAARYHADMIRRMQLEIQGIRPALLSAETAADLDELRRFRHLFRHAYSANLDPDKVADLAAQAVRAQCAFARDFERFLTRLRPE